MYESKSKTSKSKTNKPTGEYGNLVYGKVQPQALALEEAVLGAIMLDKEAMSIVLDILTPSSFYLEAHQHIYNTMMFLYGKSLPIDLLTVTEELKKRGQVDAIGGTYYLVELSNRVASAANIEYHARIISQKHIQRELISVSTKVITDAFEETTDVFDLLDEAESNLFAITDKNLRKNFESMDNLSAKFLKQIELLSKKEDGLTGVPSGFADLDKITAGWQPSDLIIIAARPAMGKTAFTLSLARNAAVMYNKPVAFFSLEMSNLQLVQRIVAMESELRSENLKVGKLDKNEWAILHNTVDKLSKAPIFIDDTPGINIFELRAKCRRLKTQHDIQLIMIDYLQLMSGSSSDSKGSGNREQEISSISRALKGLAKELNVPVIALSQLSRAVETRGGTKKPQLSDLRESGAIEQDADIVSFIYRPEYYKLETFEDGKSAAGVAEIIIAKHRNGSIGDVRLNYIKEISKFSDYEDFDMMNLGSPYGNNFGTQSDSNVNIIQKSSRINDDDVPF
jgi:replicative DNA helicase